MSKEESEDHGIESEISKSAKADVVSKQSQASKNTENETQNQKNPSIS